MPPDLQLLDVWIGELNHRGQRLSRLKARATSHLRYYVESTLEVGKKITWDYFIKKVLTGSLMEQLLGGSVEQSSVPQLCQLQALQQDSARWTTFCDALHQMNVVGITAIDNKSYLFLVHAAAFNGHFGQSQVPVVHIEPEQMRDTLYGLWYWDCPLRWPSQINRPVPEKVAATFPALTAGATASKMVTDFEAYVVKITRDKATLKKAMDVYYNTLSRILKEKDNDAQTLGSQEEELSNKRICTRELDCGPSAKTEGSSCLHASKIINGDCSQCLSEQQNNSNEPQDNTCEPQRYSSEPQDNSNEEQDNSSEPQEPQDYSNVPQDNSIEPQDNSVKPHVQSSEPQDNSSEPQVFSIEAQDYSSEPREISCEQQENSSEPQENSSEPQFNTSKPQVHSSEPQVYSSEPQLNSSEPQVNTSEPQVDSIDPLYSCEPQNFSIVPQVYSIKPQDYPNEPQDSSSGPQDNSIQAQPVYSIEAQDYSGEIADYSSEPQNNSSEPQDYSGEIADYSSEPQINSSEPQDNSNEGRDNPFSVPLLTVTSVSQEPISVPLNNSTQIQDRVPSDKSVIQNNSTMSLENTHDNSSVPDTNTALIQNSSVAELDTTVRQNSTVSDINTIVIQNSTVSDVSTTVRQNSTVSDVNTRVRQNSTVSDVNTTVIQNSTVSDVNTTAIQDNSNEPEINTTVIQNNSPVLPANTTVKQENSTVSDVNTTVIQNNSPVLPANTTVKQENSTVSDVNTTVIQKSTVSDVNTTVIQNFAGSELITPSVQNKPCVANDNTVLQENYPVPEVSRTVIQENSTEPDVKTTMIQGKLSVQDVNTPLNKNNRVNSALTHDNSSLPKDSSRVDQDNLEEGQHARKQQPSSGVQQAIPSVKQNSATAPNCQLFGSTRKGSCVVEHPRRSSKNSSSVGMDTARATRDESRCSNWLNLSFSGSRGLFQTPDRIPGLDLAFPDSSTEQTTSASALPDDTIGKLQCDTGSNHGSFFQRPDRIPGLDLAFPDSSTEQTTSASALSDDTMVKLQCDTGSNHGSFFQRPDRIPGLNVAFPDSSTEQTKSASALSDATHSEVPLAVIAATPQHGRDECTRNKNIDRGECSQTWDDAIVELQCDTSSDHGNSFDTSVELCSMIKEEGNTPEESSSSDFSSDRNQELLNRFQKFTTNEAVRKMMVSVLNDDAEDEKCPQVAVQSIINQSSTLSANDLEIIDVLALYEQCKARKTARKKKQFCTASRCPTTAVDRSARERKKAPVSNGLSAFNPGRKAQLSHCPPLLNPQQQRNIIHTAVPRKWHKKPAPQTISMLPELITDEDILRVNLVDTSSDQLSDGVSLSDHKVKLGKDSQQDANSKCKRPSWMRRQAMLEQTGVQKESCPETTLLSDVLKDDRHHYTDSKDDSHDAPYIYSPSRSTLEDLESELNSLSTSKNAETSEMDIPTDADDVDKEMGPELHQCPRKQSQKRVRRRSHQRSRSRMQQLNGSETSESEDVSNLRQLLISRKDKRSYRFMPYQPSRNSSCKVMMPRSLKSSSGSSTTEKSSTKKSEGRKRGITDQSFRSSSDSRRRAITDHSSTISGDSSKRDSSDSSHRGITDRSSKSSSDSSQRDSSDSGHRGITDQSSTSSSDSSQRHSRDSSQRDSSDSSQRGITDQSSTSSSDSSQRDSSDSSQRGITDLPSTSSSDSSRKGITDQSSTSGSDSSHRGITDQSSTSSSESSQRGITDQSSTSSSDSSRRGIMDQSSKRHSNSNKKDVTNQSSSSSTSSHSSWRFGTEHSFTSSTDSSEKLDKKPSSKSGTAISRRFVRIQSSKSGKSSGRFVMVQSSKSCSDSSKGRSLGGRAPKLRPESLGQDRNPLLQTDKRSKTGEKKGKPSRSDPPLESRNRSLERDREPSPWAARSTGSSQSQADIASSSSHWTSSLERPHDTRNKNKNSGQEEQAYRSPRYSNSVAVHAAGSTARDYLPEGATLAEFISYMWKKALEVTKETRPALELCDETHACYLLIEARDASLCDEGTPVGGKRKGVAVARLESTKEHLRTLKVVMLSLSMITSTEDMLHNDGLSNELLPVVCEQISQAQRALEALQHPGESGVIEVVKGWGKALLKTLHMELYKIQALEGRVRGACQASSSGTRYSRSSSSHEAQARSMDGASTCLGNLFQDSVRRRPMSLDSPDTVVPLRVSSSFSTLKHFESTTKTAQSSRTIYPEDRPSQARPGPIRFSLRPSGRPPILQRSHSVFSDFDDKRQQAEKDNFVPGHRNPYQTWANYPYHYSRFSNY